jgi:hypothetical protein
MIRKNVQTVTNRTPESSNHVTSRGNARSKIFAHEHDKEEFLEVCRYIALNPVGAKMVKIGNGAVTWQQGGKRCS